MNYLLDTDVVSQSAKPSPQPDAARWLASVDARLTSISVISLTEIRSGIIAMPLGQKRLSIERWLEEQILPHFAGRILPVTQHIAETCADLLLTAKLAGTSPDPFDALIAATAKVHGLSVVTLNTKHFLAFNIPLTQI